MSNQELRSELRRFLKDRRARVSPADVGLPKTGRRRVPGLRREEVAALAGIGVSWYTALESGDADGVSEATVIAVADALRLTESERTYLLTLAGRYTVADTIDEPGILVRETMRALTLPAYLITASWDAVDGNDAFLRVWDIAREEFPFNAVERLFLSAPARRALREEHRTGRRDGAFRSRPAAASHHIATAARDVARRRRDARALGSLRDQRSARVDDVHDRIADRRVHLRDVDAGQSGRDDRHRGPGRGSRKPQPACARDGDGVTTAAIRAVAGGNEARSLVALQVRERLVLRISGE
jgi:transcriptional regulator with XRE-family HTH domain